ncbi:MULTISPECIES: putative leader peptide [unclassified Streptomyces]|uniref:putative leader peptide n=1 Tax=unclassified Streptomyces TaxID=2593676 RepID=UPI00332B4FBD
MSPVPRGRGGHGARTEVRLTPAGAADTLTAMPATPALVSRRHVDLGRLASAACRRNSRRAPLR